MAVFKAFVSIPAVIAGIGYLAPGWVVIVSLTNVPSCTYLNETLSKGINASMRPNRPLENEW
jgi:hypothetical protein